MQKSTDLKNWYQNQEWLLDSLTKTFKSQDPLSNNDNNIQLYPSKNLTYCNIQNKILILQKQAQTYQLKVYDVSKSIESKEAQLSIHEVQFFDAKSKNQMENNIFDGHVFEVEVNENDDSLICLKVQKLITHNNKSQTKQTISKSTTQRDGYIPSYRIPVMITYVFVGVFKSDQNTLEFWRVNIEGYARQVQWHPQSESHLNILGITSEQSKLLSPVEQDQRFYVFNCSNSFIMPEISINLSSSLLMQRNKNLKKHQFVSFDFQKHSLSYTDQGYLTLYLLTQTGKIYYISPFIVQEQLVPSRFHDYMRSLPNNNLPFIRRLDKNMKECFSVRYSSSRQKAFIDGVVPLAKLKIMKYSKHSETDYCTLQKISYTNHHTFLLGRREINNVMTCSQLQVQDFNEKVPKVTAYEIYSNLVLTSPTLRLFRQDEDQKKEISQGSNIKQTAESESQSKLYTDSSTINMKHLIQLQNETLIQSIQPKFLHKKTSFQSREQLAEQYTQMSVDVKDAYLSNYMVEYVIYKSALIVLDLSSLHKFQVKNDPSTLNITIKSIALEDDGQVVIGDAELIGNLSPQAIIFKYMNKLVAISSENINAFSSQKLDLLGEDVIDQLPYPNEVKVKYRHIGNRLAKVKQFLIQKLAHLNNTDDTDPTFYRDCEIFTEQIHKVINNDLAQVATHVQSVSEEATLIMDINRELLEEIRENIQSEDLAGMCKKLQENNKLILQELILIEGQDYSKYGQYELYGRLNQQAQTMQHQIHSIKEDYQNQIKDFTRQVDSKNITQQQAGEMEVFIRDKTDRIVRMLEGDVREIESQLQR